MKQKLGGLLLALVVSTSALAEELDPAEEAVLLVRAQAQQVEDANDVMDGLEKLSRFPEAAKVLLSQIQDPALIKALQAMSRPAAARADNPVATPAVRKQPARTQTATPPKAAKRSPALRVVGAWSAPKPKAIFLGGERYHIVYVGETFKPGPQTYTLRSIRQLPSLAEGGDRRYRVEFADQQGAVTQLVWPSL